MYKVNTPTAARPAKGLVGRMCLQEEQRGNLNLFVSKPTINS